MTAASRSFLVYGTRHFANRHAALQLPTCYATELSSVEDRGNALAICPKHNYLMGADVSKRRTRKALTYAAVKVITDDDEGSRSPDRTSFAPRLTERLIRHVDCQPGRKRGSGH